MNLRDELISKLPEALEDFLGPNYETVLNFWAYYGGLDEEQKKLANQLRHGNPKQFEHWDTLIALYGYSRYYGDGGLEELTVNELATFKNATLELIVLHKMIAKNIKPFYITLFEDL